MKTSECRLVQFRVQFWSGSAGFWQTVVLRIWKTAETHQHQVKVLALRRRVKAQSAVSPHITVTLTRGGGRRRSPQSACWSTWRAASVSAGRACGSSESDSCPACFWTRPPETWGRGRSSASRSRRFLRETKILRSSSMIGRPPCAGGLRVLPTLETPGLARSDAISPAETWNV